MKPRKAYLIEENPRCAGLALTITPVLVVFHGAGEKTATVVPFGVGKDGAWISPNSVARAVAVANLAGSRLRALAKIALRLADLDDVFSAHLAFPVVVPPAGESPPPSSTLAGSGRRRDATPWYRRD